MFEHSVHTTELQHWLAGIRANNPAAADALLRGVNARLESMACNMLASNRRVARWIEAEDVLQNTSLRLLRALGAIQPSSMREFYGFATVLMRRELIDLARCLYGPLGLGTNQAEALVADPAQDAELSSVMEQLTSFHDEVVRLPPDEREVVELIYYHGWPQAQIAQLLQVNVRTVRRRWEAAKVKLGTLLDE